MKIQIGKCNECGLIFKEGDIIEIDHISPTKLSINNSLYNKQLLHRYYHTTKTYRNARLDNPIG